MRNKKMSNYSATIAQSDMKLSATEFARRLSDDSGMEIGLAKAKLDGPALPAMIGSLYVVLAAALLFIS